MVVIGFSFLERDTTSLEHARCRQRNCSQKRPRCDVEPEVVSGHDERKGNPGGPEQPQRLQPRAPDDQREDHADQHRVGGVQARHRGIGVLGERDEATAVPERARGRQRVVDETGEEPRRCARDGDVDREAERVRDDERVPEQEIRVVVPQIDPKQHRADDEELGQPVRPAERRHQSSEAEQCVLQPVLEEEVEPAFGVEDCSPVRERRRRAAIGKAACDLVREREARPDRQLARQVGTASR
jgi:hypothetical protein